MGRQKITAEEVRKLATQGLTQSEIARNLGVAFTTVMGLVRQHNIPVQYGKHTPPKKKSVSVPSDKSDAEKLAEIKQAAGITEDRTTCTKSLMTPVEALKYNLKLPWDGKVRTMTPKDMTTDIYDRFVDYTTFSDDAIGKMFGFTPESFNVWLKKYGYFDEPDIQTTEPPLLRAHDIGKPAAVIPEPRSAAAQFAEMASRPMPTDNADGRHILGINDATEFSAPEDDLPIPFVPTGEPTNNPQVLEFFDGPNGCGARKIIIPDPPPNTAKLQITCHDYSLGQLKSILASLPAGTTISGTLHIAL